MNKILDVPFASSLGLNENWIEDAKHIIENYQN
jgi:hypothetical protein